MAVPEMQTDHPVKAWSADHLEMETPQLRFAIERLDELVMAADEGGFPLDVLAKVLKELRTQAGYLKDVIGSLERLVGDRMGEYRVTVQGVGTLERHANKSYANWHHEDLFRAVMDSVFVNPDTGEVLSDVEKIKHVYGAKDKTTGKPYMPGYNASKTALKSVKIEPDEFSDVTDNGGFKVAIK